MSSKYRTLPRFAARMLPEKEVLVPVSRPVPLRVAAVIVLQSDAAKNEFKGRDQLRLNIIHRITNNDPIIKESLLRKIVWAFHGYRSQDELWVINKLSDTEKRVTMKVFEKYVQDFKKEQYRKTWEEKKALRKEIKSTYTIKKPKRKP